MLLATGITALSRKIKDDKERKREAKQGVLTVGPSDVAKRAFEGQTSRMIQAGPVDPLAVNRVGTEIKYEDANDIEPESPEEVLPDPKKPDVRVTHGTPQVKASSPVMSETTSGILSPIDQTIADPSTPTTYTDEMHRPPTYASRPESSSMSARSPSSYSQDESLRRLKTEKNRRSSPSTNSLGTHAVRVKTKGANLSSGFPYHPALFDLKVHPDKWAAFTEQVVHATKVSASDSRKVWAAATATAMSGAIVTSVFLKKSMDRSYQEKKVKAGISDMSDGGLGSMLQNWNDQYFTPQGLFVHLELSESAMKNEQQRSKAFRKPALLYSSREDRERKEDERKYVIVVTKLDSDGAPTEALREMELNDEQNGNVAAKTTEPPASIAEMPGDTHQGFLLPELPADDGLGAIELPGSVSLGFSSEKAMQPPTGFAELEPDVKTAQILGKVNATEMEDTSQNRAAKPTAAKDEGEKTAAFSEKTT